MSWLLLALLVQSVPADAPSPQPGVVTPPRQIYMPPVDRFYPAGARSREEQGLTLLRCTLEAIGRLSNCAVHRSSGSAELDQAAFRIAQEALYEPQRIDGKPVAITAILPVRWVLAD